MQTIVRSLKLKTGADIAASDNHCRRISQVENADPDKRHLNFEYDGDNSVQHDIMKKAQSLPERIQIIEQERGIKTPRRDSIKCVELVMAAPPGLFNKEGTPVKQENFPDIGTYAEPERGSLFEKWLQANYRFAKNHFCDVRDYTNVVSMKVHLDETNPHIHIHVMPVHKGQYNAKHYLGGSQKMQALQDAYHKTMKEYVPQIEWERGEKKAITGKDHQMVKDWYQKLATIDKLGLGKQIDQFIEKTLREAQNASKITRQQVHEIMADIEQQGRQVQTESQKMTTEPQLQLEAKAVEKESKKQQDRSQGFGM
jgi:diadenosine tetraphosphate (Ap4A) HIT family hydrolase